MRETAVCFLHKQASDLVTYIAVYLLRFVELGIARPKFARIIFPVFLLQDGGFITGDPFLEFLTRKGLANVGHCVMVGIGIW